MSCDVPEAREAVQNRCGGRCEAEVYVDSLEVWTRCFAAPVEIHHALYRSHGGLVLDRAGEIDHLIGLCRAHHSYAHRVGGEGLRIDGYAMTDPDGRPTYVGTDPGLASRYGSE